MYVCMYVCMYAHVHTRARARAHAHTCKNRMPNDSFEHIYKNILTLNQRIQLAKANLGTLSQTHTHKHVKIRMLKHLQNIYASIYERIDSH
jgi:hypothetical protein